MSLPGFARSSGSPGQVPMFGSSGGPTTWAASWHQGQTRMSGDPYITHPLAVASILAELGADDEMLCAAMLHDTIEDTPSTFATLSCSRAQNRSRPLACPVTGPSSRWTSRDPPSAPTRSRPSFAATCSTRLCARPVSADGTGTGASRRQPLPGWIHIPGQPAQHQVTEIASCRQPA